MRPQFSMARATGADILAELRFAEDDGGGVAGSGMRAATYPRRQVRALRAVIEQDAGVGEFLADPVGGHEVATGAGGAASFDQRLDLDVAEAVLAGRRAPAEPVFRLQLEKSPSAARSPAARPWPGPCSSTVTALLSRPACSCSTDCASGVLRSSSSASRTAGALRPGRRQRRDGAQRRIEPVERRLRLADARLGPVERLAVMAAQHGVAQRLARMPLSAAHGRSARCRSISTFFSPSTSRKPLCIQTLTKGRPPWPHTDCAISFS